MCNDPLLSAQLTFFKSLANGIEPFLKDFQSDDPLAPFLHNALTGLIRDQLERIVKYDVLQNCSSVIDVDVGDKNNLLSLQRSNWE